MITKSWVKSRDQIRTIEDRLTAPVFSKARILTATYLTRPQIVREVLPPPLKPGHEPLAMATVATWDASNTVGRFAGGWLSLRARYEDVEGFYVLAMPMSTDVAIIFGRELFGEPKKQARVFLSTRADTMSASIERFGIHYLGIEAKLTEEVPNPEPLQMNHFHFKYFHASNGRGLESDPILTQATFTNRTTRMRRGSGQVILKPSHHDPLSEIEIVEPRECFYTEGDLIAKATRLTTVPADKFLPYSFQNIDDYTSIPAD